MSPLSQGAITEDDKIDNLQNALKSVPDTPQVVPGTLPTAEESGQRLIDAAKELYPGAFPAEAPVAPSTCITRVDYPCKRLVRD